MRRSDFEFYLPPERIAQSPPQNRVEAKLLNVLGENLFEDLFFFDLPRLLKKGDVLVLNTARVIKARFFGHKETGGAVEVLLEKILAEDLAIAQVRASKSPKPNSTLFLNEHKINVEGRTGENNAFFLLRLEKENWWDLAEHFGKMPLPPYIHHAADSTDEQNYQTVYATQKGAMAAPTAGLHFDEALLNHLTRQGVLLCPITLFVGAGTYQPVQVEDLNAHKMHKEDYVISKESAEMITRAKKEGRRVVCVGTTSLRAVESSFQKNGGVCAESASTDLFILPGFSFQVADALITNFHLPASTLLMLVSAFSGVQTIQNAYAYAIEKKYNFFSYGDALFLRKT